MPVTWDVQPYEKVSELVANYTNAVSIAATGSAAKVAKEAEVWMKQNASWRDRTDAERDERREWAEDRGLQVSRIIGDKRAREGLTVTVIRDHRAEES